MAENQKKTFAEQIDAVLNGIFPPKDTLEVLNETPFILRQVGFRNLPMHTAQSHIKDALHQKEKNNSHWHGLSRELLNELPAYFENPVMIMDSISPNKEAKNSIVVVTDKLDADKLPIIVAVMPDGEGRCNNIRLASNFVTSVYGKDNFDNFIVRNLEKKSFLYVDKEKSQELYRGLQLQLPQGLYNLDFDTIIRKSKAFVNTQEPKKSENTEKNEDTMEKNTNFTAQNAREKVQQVRDAMVKTLLEHIEKNPTDWQSGWNNLAGGVPYNGKTKTAYRGLNSLYLAVVGMARGFKDPRWVTFNQAKDLKASVKKGEKSVPVLFFDYWDKATKKSFDARTVKDMTEEEKKAYIKENVYAVLKYSSVFNAEQCHSFPERAVDEFKMSAEERENQNEAIETIIANSAAPVLYDGGNKAYYSPGTDKIHIPAIDDFDTMQDYYATALHEIAHSTGHHTRLNRDMGGGFGSESYAKEELRAELACVFMQLERGIKLEGKHIENHASYLNSWLTAAKKDSSVFFKAASDAQKIADYVAENYLQSVNSSELVAEPEKETTKENAAQLDPMTAYMQSEQQKRAAAPNSLDRLDENVKEWYTSTYPTDDWGQEINDKITFSDIQETFSSGKDIYGVLGVSDSVVRERAFARLAELRGTTYANVYDEWMNGWHTMVRNEANESKSKLIDARAQALQLARDTGEPYVTVEWTEKSNGFPNINALDIMPLSEADKKFRLLDAQAEGEQGYYQTKLHIDFVFEGKPESYENCRFNIGTEGGGIVHHIDEFLKHDTFLDDEERAEAEAALEYLQRHMEVSAYLSDPQKLAELSEEEQRDINEYVADARNVLTTTAPFANYRDNMPPTPEQLKLARERAEQIAWEDFPRDFKGDHEEKDDTPPNMSQLTKNLSNLADREGYEFKALRILLESAQKGEPVGAYITFADYNYLFRTNDLALKYGGKVENGSVIITEELVNSYNELREKYDKDSPIHVFQKEGDMHDTPQNMAQITQSEGQAEGNHKEKIALEQARNAMLDAQEQRQHYYAVRIEEVPYTDPVDGYESSKHAQVIYTISQNGRIEQLRTITVDDNPSYYLPYTDFLNYELLEYEKIEEVAEKIREPIQTYKDVLRAELEDGTEHRRSDAYYDQRVNDILDEHHRTKYGLFKREIENPEYLSGTQYANETARGEKVVSLTQGADGKNIAIIARAGGSFVVADDYHTDDGWNWGNHHTFDDQKSAEEFRTEHYSSVVQNSAQNENSGNREWLSIELPDGAVGSQYGEKTMIKMPKGEFSGYALFMPTKLIKEENGKKYLRVASNFDIHIDNDGKQVKMTGAELRDSFNGVRLDKTYKRVAPSRKFAKGLENLEKNVPSELREMLWCCYRTRENEQKGKKDKFIISPIDGKWASSKQPERWVSFEKALKYARENNCEGLSVLLDKRYGITCIDLDKCILNASTGEMKERATKLLNELKGTYAELSTSGNGVHIFLKDDILKNGTYNNQSMVKDEDPRGDLEVFDDNRIMSLTGNMISETNVLTRANSAATVYLRQELGQRRQNTSNGAKPVPQSSSNLSDNELIKWIRSSKMGSKFDDLYSGRGVSGDKSNDDAKLAYMLLYFNGGDEQQAFRIIRESGSYRPDKPDSYYQSTIKKMNGTIAEYAKRPNSLSADTQNGNKKYGRFGGNGNKGSQA